MNLKYNILKDAFSIKNAEYCRYDSLNGYISDFSRNGNVDGWDIYSNICLYGVWQNILFGTSLDNSCFISRYNIFLPVPAEKYYILKITMKLDIPEKVKIIPTKGRVMWQTTSDSSWDFNKTKDFDLNVTDQWYTYVLNMGESQFWVGEINNLRIYPFVDGKPDIRFIIKTIKIDSVSDFKCLNTQCSYYSNYSHPCKGIGTKSSITSNISKDRYTLLAGVSDKLVINIDDYGDEQLNLGTHINLSGNDMAKVLNNTISSVSLGQYAYAYVSYDTSQKKLTIFSGNALTGKNIYISGPAAEALGFDENSVKVEGKNPESGFDYAAARRLKGFEINSIVNSDIDHVAYYHNPNQATVEAGRRDFMESMSSSHAPRSININYYKTIDGDNKLLIDGSHPINDSGRLNVIKVNGTRMRDKNKSLIAAPKDPLYTDEDDNRVYNSSKSKIVLLRPFKDGSAEVINEVEVPDINKNSVSTTIDVTYSVEVDWLVSKGDLIGFYNISVLCPFSLYGRRMAYGTEKHEQEKANAVYYSINGIPEGKFYLGKPSGQGVIGMSFYAKSNRMQDDIKLEIDLGKRFNIKDISVFGVEHKTFYEYNIAACIDVNWQVDLHNDTHKHDVGHCTFGNNRVVVHRNKYYGLEALSDCITTPDNGEQGQAFSSSPLGGPIRVYNGETLQDSDPDTYHGLATIGTHCYFYVNGDAEWLNGGCGESTDPESDYWKMEFKSPWYAGEPYEYEFDPVTFSLFFPYNKEVSIHKTSIYFKEPNNFKYLSLSYYMGENGPVGNAEELHFQYVPDFTYITVDGTRMDRLTALGDVSSNRYTEVYFKNPWPWGKIEIVNGQVVNGDIYQTIANERKNVMIHEFEPIMCKGFRIYNAWHKSTKISEMEVYSSMEIEPSLLDNISVQTSIYGDDWFELPFIEGSLNTEHIKGYVNGSPRYFRLHLKSEDLFNLKEVSCEIVEEDIKSLECEDTILIDNAPRNIITDAQPVVIENSYEIPLNIIVDLPRKLFKDHNILSWLKLNSENNTINAEIGPGALIRKNDDYEIFLDKSQVAINCPSYYLKNLIDNKPSYLSENNNQWSFFKTLHINEPVGYSNNINSNLYTIEFNAVSSKYWKLCTYSPTVYELDTLNIFEDFTSLSVDKVYIQMEPNKGSGKFETTLDQYGKILPVTLIEDSFSNGQFIDNWHYDLGKSSSNNFIETDYGLRPFLKSWNKIYIEKEFLPGALSFSLDMNFNFKFSSNLKFSVEFFNSIEQLLFVVELFSYQDNTLGLRIFSTTEPNQTLLSSIAGYPHLYKYTESTGIVFSGNGEFSLSIIKTQNYFKQILLEDSDRGTIYSGIDLISFIDRVSKIRLSYENQSSNDYFVNSDAVSIKYIKFSALPYFSSDESIGFSFKSSEPVNKITMTHDSGELSFLAILISTNDNNNYEFFARNFDTTDNLSRGNIRVYSNSFYADLPVVYPWNAFISNKQVSATTHDPWLKYDFGLNSNHTINKIFVNAAYTVYNAYRDFTKIKIYGTNTYSETFSPTDADVTYLTEFIVNYYSPWNTIEFNNLICYRFIVFYWPPVDTAVHSVVFNNPIKLMYKFSTSVNTLTVKKETYNKYFVIDLGQRHALDLMRNYDSPDEYIEDVHTLLNFNETSNIEYSDSDTSDVNFVDWASNKSSVRWIKIPLLNGGGASTEKSLKLLGIYPDIRITHLPNGDTNCEWITIPNNSLTNYNSSSINISPYTTITNLGTASYDFEAGFTGEWINNNYLVPTSSGIMQSDFVDSFPDNIWASYSINFSGADYSVDNDNGLFIHMAAQTYGDCVFKTDTFYGNYYYEIDFNCGISGIISGQLSLDLVIYLSDNSKKLLLRRLISPTATAVQFLVDTSLNFQTVFYNDFFKVNKFKIDKRDAYISFLYFDTSTANWVTFITYTATEFEFSDFYFALEINKNNLFPQETIEIEYIKIDNSNNNKIEIDLSSKMHYANGIGGDPNYVSDASLTSYCQGMTYLAVDLGSEYIVNELRIATSHNNFNLMILSALPYFQGSNDSTNGIDGTWVDLVRVSTTNHGHITVYPSYGGPIIFPNYVAYRWYRLNGLTYSSNTVITSWQFYTYPDLLTYYSPSLWAVEEYEPLSTKVLTYKTQEVTTDIGPVLAPEILSVGKKINYFEFEYCESFGGGGFSIIDSNDEEILGVASFSPAWAVKSVLGWEIMYSPQETSVDIWYKVKVVFDWALYKATIFWNAIDSTNIFQKTVDLIKQTNVKQFQIRNTFGKDWGSDYTDIKFDNINIGYENYTMQNWVPDNCLSGDPDSEGFDKSWGFSSEDPKPTIILDLGQPYLIDKFVLYHRPTDTETSWLNTDYTISLATSISGTFNPVVDITNNTDSVSTHILSTPVEASFVKLEINAYTKPSSSPVVKVYNQTGEFDNVVIDGGFLREFEIWNSSESISLNSQEHPIVCIDLKHQYNISGHDVVCLTPKVFIVEAFWNEVLSWGNKESVYQYSNSNTSDPSKASFSDPGSSLHHSFMFLEELEDVNMSGGPLILSYQVFLVESNYKIQWESLNITVLESIEMNIIGPENITVKPLYVGSGWVKQFNDITINITGYYLIQVKVTTHFPDQIWGIREVYFNTVNTMSRWVALRRTTALNYAQSVSPYDSGRIDYLNRIKVYSSDKIRPTEHHWWWSTGLSYLSGDSINTKVGESSLKIVYPASNSVDFVRFIEGDTFGLDYSFAIKDLLCFWLYISDIDKLDIDACSIVFGCFNGWTEDNTADAEWKLTEEQKYITIPQSFYAWRFNKLSLSSGWNRIRLKFDEYDYIFPEPDEKTDELSNYLNYRNYFTSSFAINFKGVGSSFYMLLDDLKIERNWFDDEVSFGEKGICLTWDEFVEIPLSYVNLQVGTIEMWLKLYSTSAGKDHFGDVKSKTLFTLVGNSNESITLNIFEGNWFEFGLGNVKSEFSSLSVDSDTYDLSGFSFDIDEVFHIALSWDASGLELDSGETMCLFINGTKCISTTEKWDITDNKGVLLRLGGGNTYLASNATHDGAAIFSHVKIYNFCKEEFDINNQISVFDNLFSPNDLVYLSEDGTNFFTNESTKLPIVYEEIMPGEKITLYVKFDKTQMKKLNGTTGTLCIDWQIPI